MKEQEHKLQSFQLIQAVGFSRWLEQKSMLCTLWIRSKNTIRRSLGLRYDSLGLQSGSFRLQYGQLGWQSRSFVLQSGSFGFQSIVRLACGQTLYVLFICRQVGFSFRLPVGDSRLVSASLFFPLDEKLCSTLSLPTPVKALNAVGNLQRASIPSSDRMEKGGVGS